MKDLDLWDQSLIVIFGDHGEEFQEHGSVHHIKTLYEEVLRVPLLVKLPGGRPTNVRPRIDERVLLMDIAPTILEVAGLEPSPDMEGRSLLSSLEKRGEDRDVFTHTRRHQSNRMALLTGNWKFIFTYAPGRESVELFDLESDPLEQTSVARFQTDLAKRLWQDAEGRFERMLRWNREHLEPAKPVMLRPDQEEHLRTLGYVE
jgi:arylsulfatase A-like enzyme